MEMIFSYKKEKKQPEKLRPVKCVQICLLQ